MDHGGASPMNISEALATQAFVISLLVVIPLSGVWTVIGPSAPKWLKLATVVAAVVAVASALGAIWTAVIL